ncbi:uncharacterized protein LOC115586585 [Sparus aurata]|uniref:uncharacterized protein LOC115586585 n=1 Tax=Sparus aurata TaxID=8175 RepID=UPI0011C0F324|nr:uncharacterized protein LOC115586585 [Sparus aurata]
MDLQKKGVFCMPDPSPEFDGHVDVEAFWNSVETEIVCGGFLKIIREMPRARQLTDWVAFIFDVLLPEVTVYTLVEQYTLTVREAVARFKRGPQYKPCELKIMQTHLMGHLSEEALEKLQAIRLCAARQMNHPLGINKAQTVNQASKVTGQKQLPLQDLLTQVTIITIIKRLSRFIRISLIPSTQHFSCCRLAIPMAKKIGYKKSLNKMVADRHKNWGQYLQSTMFALRTKKQLMFGREARYPSEVPQHFEVKEHKVTSLLNLEEPCAGLKKREDVQHVLANVRKSQDKVRKRKEDRGQEDNFKVGELVLQKNIRQEQRKGGKLEADFLGPLKIVELEGKSADLVSQRGQRKIKVNIDHLIHYVQPEERVPAKLRKVLVSSPLAGPSHTQQTHTNSTHAPTSSGTPGCRKSPGPAKDTEHLIRDIWAGGRQETLWSKVGPYKVFSETLKHLAPGKELETEIVSAYLLLICMRTRTKMVDSFAMSDIWQGSQKQYKRLDLVNHDVAAGAVCHQGHWTLVSTCS